MLDPRAELCTRCGARQPLPFTMTPAGMVSPVYASMQRSRRVAGLLGIFLGTFGAHRFYTGKIAVGVVYVCFFWTGIPTILGFIEGIWYLTMSDTEFWARYPAR